MRARINTSIVRYLGIPIMIAAFTLLAQPATAQTAEPPAKSDNTPAGNAENGKKLFTSYGCYECHGHQAQGTPSGGPRLGPKMISLSALMKYVRHPSGQMPPFTAKVVSDEELTDIYAFLQSLPEPPKAASIPALR